MRVKPKLFIHIGTPKTGTTSIQSFLFKNQINLQENGIIFPKRSIFNSFPAYSELLIIQNHTKTEETVYDFINDQKAGHFVKGIHYYEKRIASEIQKILQTKSANVILSYEGFFDIHTERFHRRMDLLEMIVAPYREKFDIKIIVYYRAQDTFIESMFMLLGKYCYYALDFNTFLDEFKIERISNKNDQISLDWQTYTDIIKTHFSDAEVIVRSFEQASEINLIKDFTMIIGLSGLALTSVIEPQNVGLNKYGMYIMTHADFLEKLEREILFRLVWMEYPLKKNTLGEKYQMLNFNQRLTIYNKYYNSNKNLFKYSDEQMKKYYYPQWNDTPTIVENPFEKELFKNLVNSLVFLQKKTLIIRLLILRKKTIDRLPPQLRLWMEWWFQPVWVLMCKIYWKILSHS